MGPANPSFNWLQDDLLFLLGDQYSINRRAMDDKSGYALVAAFAPHCGVGRSNHA